jgi:NitT/TauT family transport system substrate-binding protein
MKSAIVLAALLLTCSANAHAQPAAPGSTQEPTRIVLLVDEVKAIRNFPVVLAESLGYLKSDNLVVTVMNIRDDVPTADMLTDGRVDAVMAYYHHNIVNRSEGRNFEAIATLGVTPGVKVLVANQAKDRVKTLADLKGTRIIAGGAGSSKTTVANALMLAAGYKITDYTRIANESKDKIATALRNGEADLVVAPTPDGDYYIAQGVATLFADLTTVEGTRQQFGTLFPTATIYMTSERVKAHPEIAQHLAGAFVRTLQWINAHTSDEVLALITPEISGKDRASYLKVLKQELPMFATDGRMPADAAEQEWRVLSEFNPKFKLVQVEQTYTNKFVDAALESGRAR